MAKINKDEYEILKEALSNGYEWIARDEKSKKSTFPNELWLYEYKPKKGFNDWLGGGGATERFRYDNLFQFIQWEDDEPYNISELIEEYESEETEVKKDKKWAIKEAKETINGFFDRSSRGIARHYEDELIASIAEIIDQLDEPEVLSEEWIWEHELIVGDVNIPVVKKRDLQNAIVPKQELPAIPKFVAEWFERNKDRYENQLFLIGYDFYDNAIQLDVDDWLMDNEEKFVRAWLDGYEVEEEPKYRARLKVITDKYIPSYLRTQSSNAEDRLKALEICSKYIHEDYRHLSEFTEDELKRLDIWDSDQWEIEELEE